MRIRPVLSISFVAVIAALALLVLSQSLRSDDEPRNRRAERRAMRQQKQAIPEVRAGSALKINAKPVRGEAPLSVTFSAKGGTDYRWDFGDGNNSLETEPNHTFQAMGTYFVKLNGRDASGETQTNSVIINVEPPMTALKGLQDVKAFGFYSAGLRANSGQKEDITRHNRRRIKELQNLHVTYVFVGFWPFWYDTPEDRETYHEFLDEFHQHGIRVVVQINRPTDWFADRDRSVPRHEWRFDLAGAEARYRSTDLNGDGISDLNGRIDVLYLAHEVMEYVNHAERVKMYQLAKQYFPDTPVLVYYGGALNLPAIRAGKKHPAGGLWDDYQLGPGEADIIHFTGGRPFAQDASGNRHYAIQSAVDRIRELKEYADKVAPELPVWVHTSFGGDEEMENDPGVAWEPEEILGWAKAALFVGDIQGLFFRGYGRFEYDLGYGLNTENPEKPESGFVEQRRAFRTIGEWIQAAQKTRPPAKTSDTKGD